MTGDPVDCRAPGRLVFDGTLAADARSRSGLDARSSHPVAQSFIRLAMHLIYGA